MSDVCFVATHPNSANHFTIFTEVLENQGMHCKVVVTSNLKAKFVSSSSEIEVLDPQSATFFEQLEKVCASQQCIVTDIGLTCLKELHTTLQANHPEISRIAYYDNSETFVPGEHSKQAAAILPLAHAVFFANSNHVTIGIEKAPKVPLDLGSCQLFKIGYYPKKEAELILQYRQDSAKVKTLREALFKKLSIPDEGQSIFVYVGGANEVYYNLAFPQFLTILEETDLDNAIVLFQKHPRTNGSDIEQFNALHLTNGHHVISEFSTIEALAIADLALYYQTNMAAQFAFSGIPTSQIGHEVYEDVLVRSQFPSVQTPEQFKSIISKKGQNPATDVLEQELGIEENWQENLTKAIQVCRDAKMGLEK